MVAGNQNTPVAGWPSLIDTFHLTIIPPTYEYRPGDGRFRGVYSVRFPCFNKSSVVVVAIVVLDRAIYRSPMAQWIVLKVSPLAVPIPILYISLF